MSNLTEVDIFSTAPFPRVEFEFLRSSAFLIITIIIIAIRSVSAAGFYGLARTLQWQTKQERCKRQRIATTVNRASSARLNAIGFDLAPAAI